MKKYGKCLLVLGVGIALGFGIKTIIVKRKDENLNASGEITKKKRVRREHPADTRSGNFVKAEDCLFHVIDLNPGFTYAYITLAHMYAREGRFQDAIHALKKATRHDESFDTIYFLMAKYAYKNEDYRNALKFIETAMEKNMKELYTQAYRLIQEKYRMRRH